MGKLSQFNMANEEKDAKDKLQEKFDTYKDMSKDQLSGELYNEAKRQKQEGTFDYEKLSSMVESLKGALDEKSYENVKRILESLR